MALTNDQITAQNFKDFYNTIKPYLSGGATGFTPIGTVIAVMGNHAPNNYLICDGTVYNIADYAELAAYFTQEFGSSNFFGGDGTTTFAVPDLRGEFLRGTGTNSHTNQGNGANVGVHQDGTEHPGYFLGIDGVWYLPNKTNVSTPSKTDAYVNTVGGRKYTRITETEEDYELLETYTSRPTNTSVLYCIAYKNIYIGISSGGGGSTYTAGNGIDITNDVISTDNMPSADMDEIVTPLPSTVPKKVKYSTEEQIVGEWIDGRPVYQKTIIGLDGIKMTWQGNHAYTKCQIPTPIQDVDRVIDAMAFLSKTGTSEITWQQHANIDFDKTVDYWSICCLEDYYLQELIVTYIKTTDQVGE